MDEGGVKKLSDDDKIQNARDVRDILFQGVITAEERSAAVAEEFIRLEVSVATIIFGFASLFLSYFDPNKLIGISPQGILMMKLAFSFSLVSLLISLGFGLLFLKRSERFWDEMLNQRFIRFKKWNQVSRREVTYEEAKAFHEGTSLEKGNLVSVPSWTWILQSTFLGVAVVTLVILTVVFLFAPQSAIMPVLPDMTK
jgi:hypothetical protein